MGWVLCVLVFFSKALAFSNPLDTNFGFLYLWVSRKRLGPYREAGLSWKITAPKDQTVPPLASLLGLRIH